VHLCRVIPVAFHLAVIGLGLPVATVVGVPQGNDRDQGVAAPSFATPNPSVAPAEPASNAINHLITRIVLDSVPHEYADHKDWGKTTQRWQGVRLRRDGWKLETKRAWTTVNHGLWKKYTARLVDPERQFSVELANVRAAVGEGVAFDLTFVVPLAVEVRQARWINGVQLYSISADVEAKIRLTISCELSSTLDSQVLPPDVIFRPQATAAELRVEKFDVKRVSKVGGEFAEQVTQLVETQLDDLAAAQEPKIVEKINRQIDKRAADFRVKVSDAIDSPWAEKLWPTLR
jgi:hypothetical protein